MALNVAYALEQAHRLTPGTGEVDCSSLPVSVSMGLALAALGSGIIAGLAENDKQVYRAE